MFHGEPISITSGTRCSTWNREQGGAAMSAHLDGEFGTDDVYIGVPVKLGINGVEEIIELKLTDTELASLQASAKIYKEGIGNL